jgi:hypothetical protein
LEGGALRVTGDSSVRGGPPPGSPLANAADADGKDHVLLRAECQPKRLGHIETLAACLCCSNVLSRHKRMASGVASPSGVLRAVPRLRASFRLRCARCTHSEVVFSSHCKSIVVMPSSIALRRSPNPGAFTVATLRPPRSLLTTSVASASPSTSSAMTTSGFVVWTTASSSGKSSCRPDSFFSYFQQHP